MKILVADDDPLVRTMLRATLTKWGHDATVVEDGRAAWGLLRESEEPLVAILDWVMPHLSGDQLCALVRDMEVQRPLYVIMLTSKQSIDDVVAGLEAGADDFIRKPFDPRELQARLNVGIRMVEVQADLARQIREVESMQERERELRSLVPICGECKSVRDDRNYWQKVEQFMSNAAGFTFTEGICPQCYDKLHGEGLDHLMESGSAALDPGAEDDF